MNIEEQIKYQRTIIKHAKDLGCPDSKIIDDIVEYPEHSKELLDEAKRYDTQHYYQKANKNY